MTVDALDAVAATLASLRDVRDSDVLERRFCRDAAEICGFTRVMLSRVEVDEWRPWKVSFAIRPEFDRHFATHLRGVRIAFGDSWAEDRARRERTRVVFDPETGLGAVPLPLVGLATAYIVVPLVASDGVFGLVHADCHGAPHRRDGADRDALWLLADGFSLLYERAVLGERLRAQLTRLRRGLADLEAGASALVGADLALDRHPGAEDAPPLSPAAGVLRAAALTTREQDVAELLAKGYDNAAIARDLVIVEGTVKTHVKNVMRKLGAGNRAEAIAILLGHPTRR